MTFKFKNRHHARIMKASTMYLLMHSDTLMCDVSSGHYFFQVSKHHMPSLRQPSQDWSDPAGFQEFFSIPQSWRFGGVGSTSYTEWTRNLIRLSSACHKSDQDVPQSRVWFHHVQASRCCILSVLVYAPLSNLLSPPVGPTGVSHFLCLSGWHIDRCLRVRVPNQALPNATWLTCIQPRSKDSTCSLATWAFTLSSSTTYLGVPGLSVLGDLGDHEVQVLDKDKDNKNVAC